MSMFQGASDVHIHGGNFHANGPSGTDKRKTIVDAMALLSSRAENGASYDAAAREDVPKCHEYTRVTIIDDVHRWARSREADAPPLMWIYGSAGSGKTTIMQTVAETFDQQGILAASFFFSTQSTARPTDKESFIITLVYQLSLHIPALKPYLADALSDTSILTKSLSKQLDVLVIGPLNKLTPEEIRHRRIVLVDGLDECGGDTAQHLVLTVLERFLRQVHHRIRILIGSRPLSHIREFFSRGSITDLTQTTSLDNNRKSDTDIRRYLISQFWSIQDRHPESGGLSPEWPSHSDIDILVQRASGQFIYATTVMKSIGNPDRHPDESLQTIIYSLVDGEQIATKSMPPILQVPEGHITYGQVVQGFQSAWKHPEMTIPTIKKVYKIIENQSLLQSYDAYKRAHGNKEVYGYHGTSKKCMLGTAGNTTLCNISGCALCSIIRTSFKVSLANPEGSFGAGIYFSSVSNKAYGFAGASTGAMLLTKVVIGRAYIPTDWREVRSCPSGYDSVVFDRQNGKFNDSAVYTDDAIRPVFVILF